MAVTWIEASAGTGKTFQLVQEVLSLVRDRGVSVENILLVTFTEKATAELKGRIRSGLREAWKAEKSPRLAQALEDLPSMAITTIHGFCRTLLGQFPLEAGVAFAPEMVDQDRQWRRLLREQVRSQLTELDPALLAWAGLQEEEALLEASAQALNQNLFSLPVLHPTPAESRVLQDIRRECDEGTGGFAQAQRELDGFDWPTTPAEAFGEETAASLLNARNCRKPYEAVALLSRARTATDWAALLAPGQAKYFATWREDGSMWKKAAQPPFAGRLEQARQAALAFADALEAAESALPEGLSLGDALRRSARWALLEQVARPVLEKRSARELTFHDLIERVSHLVETSAPLVEGARARWSAVLIDEFQDTDTEQWRIFSRLFLADRHHLVLVGDPKQSIYRFRGADLRVYFSAKETVREAGAEFRVLDQNFRSTPAMIDAVNQAFDPSRRPVAEPVPPFSPVSWGGHPIAALMRGRDGSRTELPALVARSAASEAQWHSDVVETILELLDGESCLDDGVNPARPLTPDDILVLVRTKKEAWKIHRLLSARGVPATVGGSGGLLSTREAREVLLFLKALEAPRSLSAVRALAWTSLFEGAEVEPLAAGLDAAQEDRDRGAYLRAFRRVAAALEPEVIDGGGLERLLQRQGGRRRVTNAEQVLELVQERSHRGEVAPGRAALALETWIESRLQEDEVDLRRDGETPTLSLMTIHAAKGLEAPVVIHGWPSESSPRSADWLIVDGSVDALVTAESRRREQQELAAEQWRLSYVALTRARSHQIMVGGSDSPSVPSETSLPRTAARQWKAPASEAAPLLREPLAGLSMRHPWVESHSGLWKRSLRQNASNPTVGEYSRPARADDDESPFDAAEALPAGPAFGDLVHAVLEKADFLAWAPDASTSAQQANRTLIEAQCQLFRTELRGRDYSRALEAWLRSALSFPVDLPNSAPLVWNQLNPSDCRRELEFHLPLSLPPGQTKTLIWKGRTLTVFPGYLTGRIDLIFRWDGRVYLADWKTNKVNPGQSLDDVMREHGYDLQAQWYWEAVRRLGIIQQQTTAWGGVVYFFLRGNGSSPAAVVMTGDQLEAETSLRSFIGEVDGGA